MVEGDFIGSWSLLADMAGYYDSTFDPGSNASGCDNNYGICTDKTYLWIADSTDDKIYKFNMSGVYQDESWALHSANASPLGIDWYGNKIRVADSGIVTVYIYVDDG